MKVSRGREFEVRVYDRLISMSVFFYCALFTFLWRKDNLFGTLGFYCVSNDGEICSLVFGKAVCTEVVYLPSFL